MPQSNAKVAASFAAINAKLIREKAANDDYNVPYNMLSILCETNKFGNMAVGKFVETLLAPVPALQKTVAKIISELEQSERKNSDAINAATATLINWNEMITKHNLKLQPDISVQTVIRSLGDLGVDSLDDLVHTEVEDLVKCGLKKVSATKLKALVDAQRSVPRPPTSRDSNDD